MKLGPQAVSLPGRSQNPRQLLCSQHQTLMRGNEDGPIVELRPHGLEAILWCWVLPFRRRPTLGKKICKLHGVVGHLNATQKRQQLARLPNLPEEIRKLIELDLLSRD